jgi:hypothetical protein
LVFVARDADSHIVHGWYGQKTLFNRASVPDGPEQRVVLDRAGLVTLTCDLHAEMRAWVIVSTAPYSAVTDADGSFQIEAPAGRYRVRVWRPGDTDAEGRDLGERTLSELTDLKLPALEKSLTMVTETPPPAPPRPPHLVPDWAKPDLRRSWPGGNAAYVLSIVGVPLGFALAWSLFWLGARRRWSLAVGVLGGCALAFSLGALSVIGLSAAVATGLGFGAFMGTVLGSARHV